MNRKAIICALSLISATAWSTGTDFNNVSKGEFTKLKSSGLEFEVMKGRVGVIEHVIKGFKKALHMTGGQDNTVIINLPEVKERAILSMDIERWTAADPFKFTVEALVNGQWVEFHKLGNETSTGSKNYKIDLQNTLTNSLRFRLTSPANKGAIVDNIRLEKSVPMVFKGFGAVLASNVPFFKGDEATTAFEIGFEATGSKNALSVKEISLSLKGASALEKLQLFAGKKYLCDLKFKNGNFSEKLNAKLPAGVSSLRLVTVPKKDLAVGTTVRTELKGLKVGTKSKVYQGAVSVQRVASHVVWPNYTMEDGTFVKGFRIPGMVRSKKGTLIAVYDIRYNNHRDLPADIDIGMSRSTDDGNTWTPVKKIIDLGGRSQKDGVGDPAILVDDKTGRLWCAYLWASGGNSLASSKPGMKLGQSGQFMLSYSDDDGLTWSEPRNITKEIDPGKDWRMILCGPGNGITMRDGTLVFAAQYWDGSGRNPGTPYANIVYSKDGGKTWECSKGAKAYTSEAQVVELEDGSLMLNMRYEFRRKPKRDNRHNNARAICVTKDLGESWTEHKTSCAGTKALPEPRCQASLLRVASKKQGDKKNILAFFNPNEAKGRFNMTLQLSFDEGESWTHKLLINPTACYGYSSISMLDKETIGLLYETRGGLMFDKIKIADVPQMQ